MVPRVKSEIQLAVLDLMGTTVRDTGQVARAFARAFAAHDLVVSPEQVALVRGSTKRMAVRRLVPPGADAERRAVRVYATFRDLLAAQWSAGVVEPLPGADSVIAWLRGRRIRVALTTGLDRDLSVLVLDALRWGPDSVDAIVCGEDVSEGRPAPALILRAMELTGISAAQQVISVGDTTIDLEAGHRAGVRWNVGVLSGAHDRRRLEAAPHTHLLPSIAELPALFAEE